MNRISAMALLFAGSFAAALAHPTPSHAGGYRLQTDNGKARPAGGRAAAGAATVVSASPGKNSAYAQGIVNLSTAPFGFSCSSPQPLFSVQISKGKGKSVLAVNAFVSFLFEADAGAKAELSAYTAVNGVLTPLPVAATVDCFSILGETATCTVTDTEWYDLDALQRQFPGQFVGQSLNIDLIGCIATDDAITVSLAQASLEAVMEKK